MEDLKRLIQPLLNEYKNRMIVAMPTDLQKLEQMFESLVTVRKPGYTHEINEEWLALQDRYLSEKREKKGIVTLDDLQSFEQQFKIPVKPMYLQEKMKPTDDFTLFHSDKMFLWQGDITRLQADAIVNAANTQLLGCFIPGHKCIDNVIHNAAGIQVRYDCDQIIKQQGHNEPNGFAKMTSAYNLPSQYILHTVGPIVDGWVSDQDERELASCYASCLALAEENKLESVAFCSISTGVFRFPKTLAAHIALQAVDEFLDTAQYVKKVIFDVYSDEDYEIYVREIEKVR